MKLLTMLLCVSLPVCAAIAASYNTVMVDSNRNMKVPAQGFGLLIVNGVGITNFSDLNFPTGGVSYAMGDARWMKISGSASSFTLTGASLIVGVPSSVITNFNAAYISNITATNISSTNLNITHITVPGGILEFSE